MRDNPKILCNYFDFYVYENVNYENNGTVNSSNLVVEYALMIKEKLLLTDLSSEKIAVHIIIDILICLSMHKTPFSQVCRPI